VNDQTLALLVGAGTMAFLTVVNAIVRWYFPPGRISNWAMKHSQPADDEDEKG
jgi:hypothetical protein